MPKGRGVIEAILKATRPEDMALDERKRRDRVLLLAVLAGWFVALFELAALVAVEVLVYRESALDLHEMVSAAAWVSLWYFPPILLSVLPFFVLYRRTVRRGARVFTIAAGSLSIAVLIILIMIGSRNGWVNWDNWADLWSHPLKEILIPSMFCVPPALTVLLIISRSQFFRRGKGDSGAAVPVSVSAPAVDHTQNSGGVEFSTPRIAPA